jgi:hypothetical protein
MIGGSRSTQPPNFFRFRSASWLVCDWDIVRTDFLDAQESRETALEQAALEFIRKHAHVTENPAEVLSIYACRAAQ